MKNATIAVQNATTTEVSYDQFGVLLQNLSAEIQNVKGRAKSKKEQEMLSKYVRILESYEHSYRTWKMHIDFNKDDPEFLTTVGDGVKRSSLIRGYWSEAAEEFKKLNP